MCIKYWCSARCISMTMKIGPRSKHVITDLELARRVPDYPDYCSLSEQRSSDRTGSRLQKPLQTEGLPYNCGGAGPCITRLWLSGTMKGKCCMNELVQYSRSTKHRPRVKLSLFSKIPILCFIASDLILQEMYNLNRVHQSSVRREQSTTSFRRKEILTTIT